MVDTKTNRKIKLPTHKTKIICTIGPASRHPDVLEELMKNGMNVARLNFSFGSSIEHRKDIRLIKKTAAELEKPITILIDLPGSKIRIGTLESEPLLLKKNTQIILTSQDIHGTDTLIPVKYRQLLKSVSKGQTIYLNDGFIQLKVQAVVNNEVRCNVIIGGALYSSKGVNLPGANLFLDAVTQKDLEFIDFGLKEEIGESDCNKASSRFN